MSSKVIVNQAIFVLFALCFFKPHSAWDWRSFGAYSGEFQVLATEELALLPEGSVIAELLSDYAVMRQQARVFGASGTYRGLRVAPGARPGGIGRQTE